jgi:pimeloyl-ACP methyl ester carboxylesterase
VILDSGISAWAVPWRFVQDDIARTTRVCAYDRAGSGASSPGPLPRDTRAAVADLEALLMAAAIKGPYVMVGHSMGGYDIRLFADRRPVDVAGIPAENKRASQHSKMDSKTPKMLGVNPC